MFRPSRAVRDGPDPFLRWKIRAFAAGAGMAFAGFATERPWLVWAATAVLVVALALRFASRWTGRSRAGAGDDEGLGA